MVGNLFCLIRHRKFPIVLIAVGQGEGDDVISSKGDVELQAVWGHARIHLHVAASAGGDFNGHLAEVLGEDHGEVVAIDGGMNGGAFWCVVCIPFHNKNMAEAIH